MKRVYFVRHGESEANRDGVHGGRFDTLLTEAGREQAAEVARQLTRLPHAIDAVIASPLKRARETAEIVAAELGDLKVELDERIMERDVGRYSGKPRSSTTEAEIDEHTQHKGNEAGVEYFEDVEARLKAFIKELEARAEDTILVVGHAASSRTLRQLFGGHDTSTQFAKPKNSGVLQMYPEIKEVGL